MNILITGGAWHHEIFGGAYKVATEFSEYLAKSGHKVFYLAWSRDGNFTNPTMCNGVEVWRYPAPTAKSPNPLNVLAHITGSRRIVQKIAANHPIDNLNGHDFLQFLGASQGLPGKETTKSFSVHSPLVMENKAQWGIDETRKPSLRHGLAVKMLRHIEKSAYRNADIIQTDSRFTLQEISRDYGSVVSGKGIASPLWVEHERFRPATDKSAVRKALGGPWETDVPIFFTLRRLVPRMGIDNLIGAMSLLEKDGKDCRLIIGGSGPERESLEALVADLDLTDRVFFIGRIPEDSLVSCYQAPDCFVLPTRALECFGLIILEAFSCGIPVIATPVGSIPEVMGDLGVNFLTKNVSADALAAKMAGFLEGNISWDSETLVGHARSFSFDRQANRLAQTLFPNLSITPETDL